MGKRSFGVFKPFWNQHPHYLPFLNFYVPAKPSAEWNLEMSLATMRKIVRLAPPDILLRDIKVLLSVSDWRPHLVAGLAILALPKAQKLEILPYLKDRIEKGSWVVPQLWVVLERIDPGFEAYAQACLDPAQQTHEKSIASIKYLLSGEIIMDAYGDSLGKHAKEWKERLEGLIQQKKVLVRKE